ncbi:MAG: MMPL family transporter [Solirubrobacterales bacterium]|nr:MMPL family transporter [Solirubrobacterales bacterium]
MSNSIENPVRSQPNFGDGGLLSRLTRKSATASARRPKTVIALWLVLVFGLFAAGTMTGTKMLTGNEQNVGESKAANALLAGAGLGDPAVENLMVSAGSTAATRAATTDLVNRLQKDPDVTQVGNPYGARGALTDGGRKALVQATLRGDPEEAVDHVDGVIAATAAAKRANPGMEVNAIGPGTLDKEFEKIVEGDLRNAEMISVPITLLILLVAFGALVAASVPLMLGVTSVIAAMGGLALISQVFPAGDASSSMLVLLGLAVGVDYSLFYIRREREERENGRGADAALFATSATVGRAIIISGVTVIIGLIGLAATGLPMFISMALSTMFVVLVAMIGSLTVLPAVLALLGDRINKGRIPLVGRFNRRRAGRGGISLVTDRKMGFWDRLARMFTRRPLLALVAAACLLGAIAIPAIGLNTGESEYGLPKDSAIMVSLRKVETAFPGAPATTDLVVTGDSLNSSESRKGLEELGRSAREITGGSGKPVVRIGKGGKTALVRVPAPERGPATNQRVIHDLRDELPSTLSETLPGSQLKVTGETAETTDWGDQLRAATPIVIGVILLLALVLLIATFRSVPLALSVVGLNLLSMAATYGILVAVFQNTWAEGLLDFTSNGSIAEWVPLNAFVILFGLSMDYTILVLERIRESRRAGRSPRAAAREGVAATAGTVTSAAAVMVAVFAIFPTLPMLELKMLGIALSVGILIDATIVRGIALPAMVALLGERGVRAPSRERSGRPRSRPRKSVNAAPESAGARVAAWADDAR